MKRIEIYTDGACRGNPGPGGWGALLKFDNHEKEISGGEDNTTNNRMELLAAIRAIESIKETLEISDLFYESSFVSIKKIPLSFRFSILVARRVYRKIGHNILKKKQ